LAGIAVVLAALCVGVVATGGEAAHQAGSKSFRYRVILVSHSSRSEKNDPPYYVGHSTSTWKLARGTRHAPNIVSGYTSPGFTSGLGQINVRGVFTADATTNFGSGGHCTLSAPTGSADYPAAAPGDFMFALSNDPNRRGRVLAAWGLGGSIYASLSNPYFGTECSTSVSGEPDVDETHLVSIARSALGARLLTIRSKGSTAKDGITYSWSTTFVLRKIVKKKRR